MLQSIVPQTHLLPRGRCRHTESGDTGDAENLQINRFHWNLSVLILPYMKQTQYLVLSSTHFINNHQKKMLKFKKKSFQGISCWQYRGQPPDRRLPAYVPTRSAPPTSTCNTWTHHLLVTDTSTGPDCKGKLSRPHLSKRPKSFQILLGGVRQELEDRKLSQPNIVSWFFFPPPWDKLPCKENANSTH